MENDNQAPQAAPEFTPGIANSIPQPAPVVEEPAAQPAAEPQAAPAADPTPQAPATPATPAQPEQPNQPVLDYDAYLDSLVNDAAKEPVKLPEIPSQEVLQNDEKALGKFFEDLVDGAVQKSKAEMQKHETIKEAETKAWNDVFDKYPEIKEAKGLRDTIHNIRIGAYQRGQALSPVQVADQLIGDLRTQYKKGVNDVNVQTTVRDSQPLGGGTQTPASPAVDYSKLHHGGDAAAIAELTKLIEGGKV